VWRKLGRDGWLSRPVAVVSRGSAVMPSPTRNPSKPFRDFV